MTLSDHSYLKSAFGTGTFDLKTFQTDLQNSTFNSQIRGLSNNQSNVVVTIESITGGQQSELDGIVANHVPNTSKPRIQHFTVYPKRNSSKTTVYIRSHVFNYLGSLAVGPINYFDLSAYLDSGTNTYDARIINTSTGAVLVEKTGMNNRFLATIDLGPISNIPTAAVDLELQIRKQGNSNNTTIEVENLVVYYGN